MKYNWEMINHILELIRNNKLKKAFQSLDDLLVGVNDKDLHMRRDLLQSRFNRLREAEYNGLEKRYEEENAVTQSLLELTYEIDEQFLKADEKNLVNKEDDYDSKEDEEFVQDALSIFNSKLSSLSYKSTQKDVEELFVLKDQISSEIFEGLNQTIVNIPKLKYYKPVVLFESIYSREKLTENLVSEINEIRNDKNSYSASDRVTVVSGLVCSLLNFKKLDHSKVVLLFDFLSDNESTVRDHALVGIIIALIYHNSRWQRFPRVREKIEFLKQNVKIQDDLQIIETIFQYKLYEINVIGQDHLVATNEDVSVAKYFLPFDIEGKQVEELISGASDYDKTKELAASLVEAPLIDFAKYSILNSFSQFESEQIEKQKQEAFFDSEEFKNLVRTMTYLSRFQPFISIISNYYFYYNLFPTKAKIELFENKLTIGRSKLRDYVLSEKKKYLIKANELMRQEKYNQAIGTWKDLLIIDPANKEALWKITQCYYQKEDFANSIKYGHLYLDYKPDDTEMLRHIALSYLYNDDSGRATKTIKKVIKLEKKKKQITLFVAGKCFLGDKKIEEAIKYFEEAKSAKGAIDQYKILDGLGDCYYEKEEYEEALKYHLMALELEPEDIVLVVAVTNDYANLYNYEKAYQFAKRAFELKKNRADVKFLYARNLFVYGQDPKRARKLLIELSNKQPSNVIFGNLGHWELIYGEIENALKYYRKCVLMFEDIEEFTSKYDHDIPIVTRLGADEKSYLEIKDKMIEYYNQNNDQ